MAVDLLAKYHRQLDLESLPRLLQLVQRQSWWDTVDGLADVVGDILPRARAGQRKGMTPIPTQVRPNAALKVIIIECPSSHPCGSWKTSRSD